MSTPQGVSPARPLPGTGPERRHDRQADQPLEAVLRVAFLEKMPRLSERYVQSWPTSDMAERSHSMHQLRLLPDLGGQFLRLLCELVLTTTGIAWLAPVGAPLAVLAAGLTLGLPLLAQPLLTGLRRPESGQLLLGGLDRQTLGAAGW